jgi:hypothetical protein
MRFGGYPKTSASESEWSPVFVFCFKLTTTSTVGVKRNLPSRLNRFIMIPAPVEPRAHPLSNWLVGCTVVHKLDRFHPPRALRKSEGFSDPFTGSKAVASLADHRPRIRSDPAAEESADADGWTCGWGSSVI